VKPEPSIEEIRSAGQKYVESFKGNHRAMIADLRRRSKSQGRQLVASKPSPRKKRLAAAK
jgi:hypothetical protein